MDKKRVNIKKTEPAYLQRKIRDFGALRYSLEIQYKPASVLKPDPKNPRFHSDKQVQQIARSIQTFGFNVPILVDADLRVVAGHGRLLACKLLGIDNVPVIRLDHLSEHERRAFLIAENRTAENAKWDDRLLGEQLKILSEAELDFTLETTGFELGQIGMMIENLVPATNDEIDPVDLLPESKVVQISRPGDLWKLGKHRICCGDALSAKSYGMLMEGRKANVIFTDPPYNVPGSRHTYDNGKVQYCKNVKASGDKSESESIAFLADALNLLAQNSLKGSIHYICMAWRYMPDVLAAGTAAYSELKDLCIWIKQSAEMGSIYRSQHELVFVFQNGSNSSRTSVKLGPFDHSRSNVWRYPSANSLSRTMKKSNLTHVHSTIKPVAIVQGAVLDSSMRGDTVLDPFLGSGTTLIAAELSGRICNGMEVDPACVDLAIRRWQTFTGQCAMQESTGRTFKELEEEAHERES